MYRLFTSKETERSYGRSASGHQHFVWNEADHIEDVLTYIENERVTEYRLREYEDRYARPQEWKRAIKRCREGWPEGRELLKEAFEHVASYRPLRQHRAEALDVGGSYPIASIAAAGDPQCMVSRGLDIARSKPVIRLITNMAVTGHIRASGGLQRRGAAILAWADYLESCGYRCEILVIETGAWGRSAPHAVFTAPIKMAHEPLDLDRASFMLCHPAMQTAIFFPLYDRCEYLAQHEVGGYGSPTDDLPAQLLGEHSVYFNSGAEGDGDWATPALAAASVERHILKSLQLEDLAADKAEMEGMG